MSVSFYMDENVHGAITDGLRRRGFDVLTVQEDGRDGDADEMVLDRAADLGRVVFTTDDGFLAEAARRQRAGESFDGVVYAHQMRVTIGQCIADLELIGVAAELSEYFNRVQHLPL